MRAGVRQCTSAVGCHVVTRKVQKSSACRVELAATSYVRNWHTKLREVLRCQAVKALIHRRAQFEGDALWNIQPVHFIVEDMRQTPIDSALRRVRKDSIASKSYELGA